MPDAVGWYDVTIEDMQQEPGWGTISRRLFFNGHIWEGLRMGEIVTEWSR